MKPRDFLPLWLGRDLVLHINPVPVVLVVLLFIIWRLA